MGKGIFNEHCRESPKTKGIGLPHMYLLEYIRWVALANPKKIEDIIKKANSNTKLAAHEDSEEYGKCKECKYPLHLSCICE